MAADLDVTYRFSGSRGSSREQRISLRARAAAGIFSTRFWWPGHRRSLLIGQPSDDGITLRQGARVVKRNWRE